MTNDEHHVKSLRNELIIVVLALVSVALLLLELVEELAPQQRLLIERVDLGIAAIFLIEFLWRFHRAKEKWPFFRHSWWELLAAIPITSDVARALRGLRLLRIVRIVRLVRVIRLGARINVLLDEARMFGEQTQLITVATTLATVVVCGALGFHYFEYGVNPNVKSFWDSIWWSTTTITTVAYGDVYPVTTGGRVVAILLLIVGLGAFGLYTAAVASWMVRRRSTRNSDHR
jgi:voltage-gated potassium channel